MSEQKKIKIIDTDREELIRKATEKRLRRTKNRTRLVKLVFVACIIALCFKILYYKVVFGKEYEKRAVIQQTTQEGERVVAAKRGDILDRTGKSLAISSSVYNVFVDVIVLDKLNEASENKDVIQNVAVGLNEAYGYPIEDFLAIFEKDHEGKLKNKTNYFVISKEVTNSVATEIRNKKLSCIHLEESGKRVYPFGNIAAQTIGFIGGDGPSSNWGLERYYDSELTGIDGRYFVSYDENLSVKKFDIDAIAGNSVMTTIDATMQQFCDELVDKYGIQHGAQNASIIIMKPDTGEIITMSEYPRFDNNAPGKLNLITDPNFASVDESLDDSQKGDHLYNVWKNFNVSNIFEPGSIFKPVTVAFALEENIISHDDVFYCDGYKIYSDGTRVKCWIYDSTGGGHGRQSVEEALANSCNVAMMQIADKTSPEIFSKYQREFGFGSKTGIDLPGEEETNTVIYEASGLNEVELGTGSFGQGFKSTMIQNIISFAAVINGGYVLKPYVVSDIIDSSGKIVSHFEPVVLRQVISKETSDIIRNDLVATMTYGTGSNLAIDGYSIGGKTGTAEQIPRGSGKYAVSFVGYIPVNNPEYIAIGVINEPNDYITKRTSAVPMMKEVFQKLINYYNIPSDSEVIIASSGSKVFMKDYTGNVVNAVKDINLKGYNFDISGSGNNVYRQIPTVNQPIDENTTIILYVNGGEEINGEELVEVPDLVGIELKEAEEILMKLGFDVIKTTGSTYEDVIEVGNSEGVIEKTEEEISYVVTGQMPRKGIKLPINTQIRLIYK